MVKAWLQILAAVLNEKAKMRDDENSDVNFNRGTSFIALRLSAAAAIGRGRRWRRRRRGLGINIKWVGSL